MNVRLTRSRALATTAIAVGTVLAAAVPAAAAVQLQSQSPAGKVKIAQAAALKANGAGAVVTLTVTCARGDFYAGASLTQKVGNKTTSGSNYVNSVHCTGKAQTVKVAISASPKAFKAGTAFAIASVSFTGLSQDAHAQREVTLS